MKVIVGKYRIVRFIDRLLSLINRQLAIGCCLIALALSGCVKYDTGVNFSSLNYGEIVEQIQLGEQLNSFSQDAVRSWVSSIESRTQQLQGRIEHLSDRELKIVIPFNNASELATKINNYFNPYPKIATDKSQFNSHLHIDQSNFLLVVRSHLTYDIDLRSMVVKATDPKVSIASGNLVDLNFSLHSPWGVSSGEGIENLSGVKTTDDRAMNWQLKPGELNHIDAIFWLPNPLGIGGVLITIVSICGYYLKYRQLPWQPAIKS
jgi:Protein of unknown function (DUF3153)